MRVTKTISVEAAHMLTKLPPGHKCGRLHGHSFKISITVEGSADERGFVVDYDEIKTAAHEIIALDHTYLNDTIENPTSENIAIWCWDRLSLKGLCEIEVQETCTAKCSYSGK